MCRASLLIQFGFAGRQISTVNAHDRSVYLCQPPRCRCRECSLRTAGELATARSVEDAAPPDCEPSCCAAYRRRADQALSRSSGVPDPGWRTCPGSSLISEGGQRTLRAWCVGGSPCNSLSAASARSRSRRSSTILARIVAKSSTARGRVIGSSRSLDLVLTAAHVDCAMLRTAFYAMKRDAAPGVDGMTWGTYEEDLDRRIEDLPRGDAGDRPVGLRNNDQFSITVGIARSPDNRCRSGPAARGCVQPPPAYPPAGWGSGSG